MPDAILRVVLTRGPGERGYTPRAGGRPTVVMTLHPAPPPDQPVPWNLVTSSFPHSRRGSAGVVQNPEQTHARHGAGRGGGKRRGRSIAPQHEWRSGRNCERQFVLVSRDRVCTVPDRRGVLPGITRAVVLEICLTLGLANEPARHQTRGAAECRRHFHHAKRVRHRAGGRTSTANRSRPRRWWIKSSAPTAKCSTRREPRWHSRF